jgi:uncharacterized protein YkwD
MGRHRRRRGHARTGLIGASAALAVGAVAVGSGLLPGVGDGFPLADRDDVRAQDGPAAAGPGTRTPSPSPDGDRAEEPAEESREPTAEAAEPEPTAEEPSPTATPTEEPEEPAPAPDPTTRPTTDPTTEPAADPATEAPAPSAPSGPDASPEQPETVADPEIAAAEEVLALVNEERALAGCRPLTLDAALTGLADGFSRDMAERGFFSHTDPDGRTPWDRAAAAGISGLGGENIAQGQQTARAVMDSWMASEGHRANILNCDFTTLGIGVHMADGGPWWTQDFGF